MATNASLSVVVVSSGSATATRDAAQTLKGAPRDFIAQLIFVSQDNDPAFAETIERSGGEVVAAPAGSTRAEMCDLGMRRVSGSIVAVRDDVAVGNAQWLDAFRSVVATRETRASRAVATESVVMDTLVAGRSSRADSTAVATAETMFRAGAVEFPSVAV